MAIIWLVLGVFSLVSVVAFFYGVLKQVFVEIGRARREAKFAKVQRQFRKLCDNLEGYSREELVRFKGDMLRRYDGKPVRQRIIAMAADRVLMDGRVPDEDVAEMARLTASGAVER